MSRAVSDALDDRFARDVQISQWRYRYTLAESEAHLRSTSDYGDFTRQVWSLVQSKLLALLRSSVSATDICSKVLCEGLPRAVDDSSHLAVLCRFACKGSSLELLYCWCYDCADPSSRYAGRSDRESGKAKNAGRARTDGERRNELERKRKAISIISKYLFFP